MQIVDPEKNLVVFKDRIIEFFQVSGWKILQKLHESQLRLLEEEKQRKLLEKQAISDGVKIQADQKPKRSRSLKQSFMKD